jgi:hypothetical protein
MAMKIQVMVFWGMNHAGWSEWHWKRVIDIGREYKKRQSMLASRKREGEMWDGVLDWAATCTNRLAKSPVLTDREQAWTMSE